MRRHRSIGETKGHRGFTMIEAMITLLIMMVGILGMGALAAASVRSNMDAQDATRALNLADRIAGQLRTEAGGWSEEQWNPAKDVPNPAIHMPLLQRMTKVAGANGIGWDEVTKNLPGGGPMAFTRELVTVAPNAPTARYCAHYNLTWLQVNETMRADIRVYWPRRRPDNPHNLRTDCGAAEANNSTLIGEVESVSSVSRSIVLTRSEEGL